MPPLFLHAITGRSQAIMLDHSLGLYVCIRVDLYVYFCFNRPLKHCVFIAYPLPAKPMAHFSKVTDAPSDGPGITPVIEEHLAKMCGHPEHATRVGRFHSTL